MIFSPFEFTFINKIFSKHRWLSSQEFHLINPSFMIFPGWCPSGASKAPGHFRTNFEMNLFLAPKHNPKKKGWTGPITLPPGQSLDEGLPHLVVPPAMAPPAPLTMVVVVAGVSPPTDAAQSQFGGGGKQQKQKSLKLKMPALFFFSFNLPHLAQASFLF